MKIAVPDFISNSYFPVIAAENLGFFRSEGIDLNVEFISPLTDCVRALHEGEVDFIAASAHAPLLSFQNWQGAKLICAQAQGTYWFLVMKNALGIARGDLAAVRQCKIAAVPFVAAALRQIFASAGIDTKAAQIEFVFPQSASGGGVSFGVIASEALGRGDIDGFFANGIGAALAEQDGSGNVVLDVRRGDGPREGFGFTFGAVATTERLIEQQPAVAAAVVRAIRQTHSAIRADLSAAEGVACRRFPKREASLIAQVVAKDIPYYETAISAQSVATMNAYARKIGLLDRDIPYDQVVAAQFSSP